MLSALSIRDIVLVEALDLEFGQGLNVLTGETGAGKSILLDALGFALGARPARDLVRADAGRGSVAAIFKPPPGHAVLSALEEFDLPTGGDELMLRRTATEDGPSRAFVNDQRVSAEILARIGALLVEVHGQHDDRGLLAPRGHRALLDAFGGLGEACGGVRAAWDARRAAERELEQARERIESAAADAEYLRHCVDELEELAPRPGEDAELETERRLIRRAAELKDEIAQVGARLGNEGAEGALGQALSRLMHIAERAEGRLDGTIAAIDRTIAELSEAQAGLAAVDESLDLDPEHLEKAEERLFAIRALARKHGVAPDDLADFGRTMATRLVEIGEGEQRIAALEEAATTTARAYEQAAATLHEGRRAAAGRLDEAVTRELAPLKMETARFATEIGPAEPGRDGVDEVRFTAAINPGGRFNPIDRIASGGELSRFLLALKVQLARRADGLTLIFDEIDRGVGGATADAVGRRLARLADTGQVLVVTHSPQVAALGRHHFMISKRTRNRAARTEVARLDADARRAEIARMLSGDRVTDAARSAARALIEQAGQDGSRTA